MRYLLGAFPVLLLTGCLTEPTFPPPHLADRLARSHAVIENRRQEAAGGAPEEKEQYFRSRLRRDFLLHPHALVLPSRSSNKEPEADLVVTACYLITLADRYAVTQEPTAQTDALAVIDSLLAMDAADGLDGYIPAKVRSSAGRLVVTDDVTPAASVALLVAAYTRAAQCFDAPEPVARIQQHVALILRHLLKNDLVWRPPGREPVPGSDLRPHRARFDHDRRIDLLLLVNAGRVLLCDREHENTCARLQALHEELVDHYDYPDRIRRLDSRPSLFAAPSYQYGFHNLIKLRALEALTGAKIYQDLLRRFAYEFAPARSPFFDSLAVSAGAVPKATTPVAVLDATRETLEQFPLSLTSAEVINRYDPGLALRRQFRRKPPRAVRPLPVWRRPLAPLEWTQDPLRVDSVPVYDSAIAEQTEFSGVDYLMLYWCWRYCLQRGLAGLGESCSETTSSCSVVSRSAFSRAPLIRRHNMMVGQLSIWRQQWGSATHRTKLVGPSNTRNTSSMRMSRGTLARR